MKNAVIMNEITKQYPGGKRAVEHMSIALKEGEVFGFLGPNGAGKTTTVKILNGMIMPSEGTCEVLGIDPAKHPDQVHALSGVMTEHAQMYDHLTGRQNLIVYGELFGMSAAESAARAGELLEESELAAAGEKKLATYSTGMRQRLSLARAMMHRPKVLFLDEPTSGLDPESVQNVNRLIRTLAQERGITVFLCTHQLRYAQEVCTRYGLIAEGKLLIDGSLGELRRRVSPGITLGIRTDMVPERLPFLKKGDGYYEITLKAETEIPGIVRAITEAGGSIYEVTPKLPSLEDIYFALTASKTHVTEVSGWKKQ